MQLRAEEITERLSGEAESFAEGVEATITGIGAWVQDHAVEWSVGILAVAAIYFVLRILRGFLFGLLHRKKKSETTWQNILARVIRATKSLFLLLFAAAIVLPILVSLDEEQRQWMRWIFVIVIALQGAFWARVVITAFLERAASASSSHGDNSLDNALGLLNVFANVLVFAVAIVFIISNLGGDPTALIAGLGVGGIAIGLAAQSLFEDLFAGLSIILDKPFLRGDFIIFGDKMGTVQKVGLKSTRITTLQGQQLVVNNSKLLGYEINNYRRMAERRIVLRLGVTYDTPRDTLAAIPGGIRQIVEAQDRVRFDRCHLAGYGDYAILFELVFWVQDRDYAVYMDIQQDILLGVHALFERNKVTFAFPTQTLHIDSVPEGMKPGR
ncbi:mechanosensitive ion channel family protein [Parvularcula maris]|uniref:Mechanosensitive ion channel family protein n=1 Tax=Parvularcula maris TaxID=2965077 RepID=A0A9X2LBI2_9PROT|nr:mechanosensitive ion channel family protein [Parvularcula maris]MCQ8186651.1 mechanosensitive ion channel family protein [Parvularcula maris]